MRWLGGVVVCDSIGVVVCDSITGCIDFKEVLNEAFGLMVRSGRVVVEGDLEVLKLVESGGVC